MASNLDMLRAAFSLALIAGLAPLPIAQGQAPAPGIDPGTRAVVERASKYVENYRKEFSAVVCEERQIQTLFKSDGSVRRRRVLVSDLMFVKVGDNATPSGFRDVISADGRPVRDRGYRLRKLFLEKPSNVVIDQARAIAIESGRYDLGIPRIGESPLLPIGLLGTEFVSNFRFALTGRTLTFDELESPTYMRGMRPRGIQYTPSRGSFVVDPGTGAVLSASLTSEGNGDDMSRTFLVRYDDHAQLKMLVPVEMTETYRFPSRPKDDRFEAKYTYSAFRRFQVTTSEIIK